MKCNVCGSDNLEGSAYCEDCGSKLAAPAVRMAPAPAAPVPPPAPVPAPPAEVPYPAPEPVDAMPPEASYGGPFSAPAPAPVPEPAPAPAHTPNLELNFDAQTLVPEPEPAAPQAPAYQEMPFSQGGAPCATCGHINNPGTSFCEDCGASLNAASQGAPGVPPVPVTEPPYASPAELPVFGAGPAAFSPKVRFVESGVIVEVKADESLMGRNSPADGIFPEIDMTEMDPESYVSRRHARIIKQDGRAFFEDLGSSNGSFLNGNRLQPNMQTELHPGDVMRLGRTEVEYLG